MLFRQEDLAVSYDPISEAVNILNDAVYLTEDESFLSPKTIPVVENTRIGAGVVQFGDIERLAEENGADYIDAMYAIAEANEIDPNQLAVAVDEWKIIESPEIVDELANVVIKPISPFDTIGLFTEACVDLFVESGDYGYLDLILFEAEAPTVTQQIMGIKREIEKDRKKLQAGGLTDYERTQLEKSINSKNANIAALKQSKRNEIDASKNRRENELDPIGDMTASNHGTTIAAQVEKDLNARGISKSSPNYQEEFDKATKGYQKMAEKEVKASEKAAKKAAKAKKKAKKAENGFAPDSHEMSLDQYNAMRAGQDPNAKKAADVKETQSFLSKVKHYTIDTPREYIAKAITALKNKYNSFERVKNANAADPQKKTIFQKILSAISTVLSKLENLLTKKKD